MFHKLKKLGFQLLLTCKYVAGKAKSYHQGPRKSRLHILRDLLIWQIKEHDFNMMYYAFGLNLTGTSPENFIGTHSMAKLKAKVETLIKQKIHLKEISCDVITKDKFYCWSIFNGNRIPCLDVIALISNGNFIPISSGSGNAGKFNGMAQGDYFIKNVIKENGEGVYLLSVFKGSLFINNEKTDPDALLLSLKSGTWIVQKKYSSHIRIRNINSSALNTTRIYTILGSSGPEYLGGFQAFATNGAIIDSWSRGSVYVGIDIKNGVLQDYGITSISDERPGILYFHPDSLVEFKNYSIPFIKESLELCIRAHTLFYCNFLIGWDVAITDEGPLIVEANEKPGLSVLQSLNQGIRKKIDDKYYELTVEYGSGQS